MLPPVHAQCHRQLRRRRSRMHQRPQNEPRRRSRYVHIHPPPPLPNPPLPNPYPSSPQPITHNSHPLTGDRIIVVVQKQRNFGPESGPGGSVSVSAANKVRRGDIRHAVIVRTAKKYSRPDGSVVKFDDNACVLINKGGEPIGSRLSGVVGQELRGKKWSKILSLAPMHL
jgi:ribosomal protein L14